MINGMHAIIYSSDAEADKVFFKKILKLNNVDVGRGWLIFGLPPAEIAVHPSEGDTNHEIYLMCDDINEFVKQAKKNKINCSAVQDQGWGLLSQITLPGGGKLGVYQPRHARPKPTKPTRTVKKPATKTAGREKLPSRSNKKTAAKKSARTK